MTQAKNRFDLFSISLNSLAPSATSGALIPFVVAYVAILKMDPARILLGFGTTGLAKRISLCVPRPSLLGVAMGLGFSFMLEGIRMMSQRWAMMRFHRRPGRCSHAPLPLIGIH